MTGAQVDAFAQSFADDVLPVATIEKSPLRPNALLVA